MCALTIFKSALWPGKFTNKAPWGCKPVQIEYCSILSNVLTTLSPFLTHMHLYLLHMHEVSPQFEKVSWTTLDLKVKMQSVTVLYGDFWSWVGVHFVTQPCEHNNKNL